MSGYISFASGSGANQNLNNSFETIGYDTNGLGTLITANAAANNKGIYAQLSASTSNAWAGFYLCVSTASSANGRYILDVSFDGGTTAHVPNFYCDPGATSGSLWVWIPLAVASASDIRVRTQASTGALTCRVGIVGVVDNSQSAPMYTSMTALAIDTANTRAGTSSISLQGSGGTTYGDIVASTGAEYKAFLFSPGGTSSAPATGQVVLFQFATGAAAAETVFAQVPGYILAATGAFGNNKMAPFFERTIAASTRLSVRPLVNTPGTDTIFMAAYGFS